MTSFVYHRIGELEFCKNWADSYHAIHQLLFTNPLYDLTYNSKSHKFWNQSPSPYYQYCLYVLLFFMFLSSICDSFLAQASVSLLCQHPPPLSRRDGLIYFCKVDHSRISGNFFRNWLVLNDLWDIVTQFEEVR